MKIYKAYFIFPLLFQIACDYHSKENEKKIKHKTVYVSPILEHDTANIVKRPDAPQGKHFPYLEYLFSSYDLVNIARLDSTIQIELRYAGINNFLGRNLYDGLKNAYFNCETALKICNAQYFLKDTMPNYSLLILDAARPWHIQKVMWDSLKMKPEIKYSYLSPPNEASLHNYGCAVDVTILDLQTGKELDMGTGFDHFGKLSQLIYEEEFLKTGELSQQAYNNRKLLRSVMQKAKLKPINSEWWHFSICTKPEAVMRFKLIR
mgnify:FL=1